MNKFIKTKQYKQFAEFCKACHRDQYIGLCYGSAGAGKTEAAKHYSNWHHVRKHFDDPSDRVLYLDDNTGSYSYKPRPAITFSMSRLHSILYTPSLLASPQDIIQQIRHEQRLFSLLKERFLHPDGIPEEVRIENRNFAELVIIDESERLKPMAFELIRELYDEAGTSFIFIGMPGIEKPLNGSLNSTHGLDLCINSKILVRVKLSLSSLDIFQNWESVLMRKILVIKRLYQP